MPNGTYGGVRGRKTKEVGGNFENPLFSSYSIALPDRRLSRIPCAKPAFLHPDRRFRLLPCAKPAFLHPDRRFRLLPCAKPAFLHPDRRFRRIPCAKPAFLHPDRRFSRIPGAKPAFSPTAIGRCCPQSSRFAPPPTALR